MILLVYLFIVRQRVYVYENILGPEGCLPLPRGCVHVYGRGIEASSLKLLKTNQSQAWCGAFLGRVNESLYEWSRSRDQGGRRGYRWRRPLKVFFSRTGRPMILKHGMKHQAIELYKVYINHDLGMTLTIFTARST